MYVKAQKMTETVVLMLHNFTAYATLLSVGTIATSVPLYDEERFIRPATRSCLLELLNTLV